MAKKKSKLSDATSSGGNAPERGAKTRAIREYLSNNRKATPKQVIAALKEQGLPVSPNMVSITKAKMGIRRAGRKARQAVANNDATAVAQVNKSKGLEAALTLYKAARGQEVSSRQVSSSFLALVEMLS